MRPRRKSGAPGVEVSDWHNSWPSSEPTINTWPAISVRSPIWGLWWCNGQQEAHTRAIRCRETCLGRFEIQYNERKLGKSRSNPLLFIAGSPSSCVLRPNNQIRGFMNWTGPHTYTGWQQGNGRQHYHPISGSIYCCIEFQYHITPPSGL